MPLRTATTQQTFTSPEKYPYLEVRTTLQSTLETSNVSTVEEMVNMITTQRAYEMNSKVISTADQMLSFVTQNL